MPFTYIFLAGRFAELMTYIIVMFFAIRIIPIGKRALTFISLTPTALFLAVTYTYDTIVFCFISLAIGMVERKRPCEYKKNIYCESFHDNRMLAQSCICSGCFD